MAELADIRHALLALRRDLQSDLDTVQPLLRQAGTDLLVDEGMEDLDRQLHRMRSAAVITLVGATGAGKSTLLNALAGRAVAVEGETRPTTSRPVIYRPADADVSALIAGLPEPAPEVVDYDASTAGPWSEQILVDAPDVNSVAARHREVVRQLADRSDVLVVVAHRQSVAELAVAEFVDAFARRRGLIFVLNRADELTADAREDLLGQLRAVARQRFAAEDAPVLALSAREARSQSGSPGWSELCDRLRAMVQDGELGHVRRLNALGTVDGIARACADLKASRAGVFRELEAAIEGGLSRWQDRVEDEATARLALRQPHLRGLLWNETARRWDGPGGLALRVGGLSTLGLGAGAALARRNPLLAAGAALGSIAVDRARDALLQRHFADASGILPEGEQLQAWYRDELGPARLLARDLTGEALALGVPDGAALAEGALRAVDDAWGRMVDRDVLEAAAKVARWFVRWPVDLPVYAMLGWIAWQAVRGFWRGEYVGIDLLINVALIVATWLFLTRALLRGLLGSRASALLRRTQEHLSRSLKSALDPLRDAALRSLHGRQRALERLASAGERWRQRLLP